MKTQLFDEVIADLPQPFRDEITQTDQYMKSLRPLKFRRSIDRKARKITYVASDYGVSYMFRMEDGQFHHQFQWYIVYNGKPETWHRRGDFMEETLAAIAVVDHALAARIFGALRPCAGGDSCHGERCLARTVYAFDGCRRLTCHGSVALGTRGEDFPDARAFFGHLNGLARIKVEAGEPLPEKILLHTTVRSL